MKYSTSMKSLIRLTLGIALILAFAPLVAAQVRVLEGEVGESRGQVRFGRGELTIQLKVVGEMLKDARGIRTVVEKAVDDTGKNLLDEKNVDREFKSINLSGENSTQLALTFKPSERRASVVKEVGGYLELFVPGKDPKASVTVAGFLQGAGKPIPDNLLKAADIEVTVWTREQYEARRKVEAERLRKEQEEKRKKGNAEPLQDFADLLIGAMGKLFGGLADSFDELSDTALVLTVKDPNAKILDIDFENAKGEKLRYNSSSRSENNDKTFVYDFNEKLPDGARVKFGLLSSTAIVKVPFKLNNVALP